MILYRKARVYSQRNWLSG